MPKFYLIVFTILIFGTVSLSQEPVYYNNIYNPVNTYASGRGILQIDNYYYGIFGTWESPDYWYKLGVFKMDLSGNIINWHIIGENGFDYFAGSVGGTLIKTLDGNLAFACQIQNSDSVYGTLIKINLEMDTIWKKDYLTDNFWTMTIKVKQPLSGGYIIVGNVKPEQGSYYNILLLQTNNNGDEIWHQTYGGDWVEQGTDVIQTPDGGYLIGGYFWKPGYDHSLDAMVIKTDSLGNEEWTKYYGNPDIDDDMAFVALADDGNYLVATVYGEWIHTISSRTGRLTIYKIDSAGNTISESKKNPKRRNLYIKNFVSEETGYLSTGWSYTDTVSLYYTGGWIYKLDNNTDSVFRRGYQHFFEETDNNYLYDVTHTSDNGYIAIGQANEAFTQNNMWIIKVDSMGCDTAGCATGVFVEELSPSGGGWGEDLKVWPNPAKDWIHVKSPRANVNLEKTILIYNSQGIKVDQVKVPGHTQKIEIDVSNYTNGLYYLQYIQSDQILETIKFIKN